MRTFATLIAGIICVCLGGCGEVGEPLYPALRIPTRVTDLTAVERGDHIDVHFTIPAMTTEGQVLKGIGGVDLRIGASSTPFNLAEWANNATRPPAPPVDKPGSVTVHVPAEQFIGKDVVVGVRVANTRGRNSDWSNLATVTVEQPLATPADVKAAASPQGVVLTWNAAGAGVQFHIYRKAELETMPSVLATVNAPNYADTTAEYGKTYEYYVESFRDKTVSDVAGPVSITPKDTFPPHVPTGLTASAGLNSIEVAWDRNTEPDFKEYRVARSEEGAPFVQVAAGLEAPAYSDHNIESGKHYRYRVAAVDQAGNVSEPSEPVEAVAP